MLYVHILTLPHSEVEGEWVPEGGDDADTAQLGERLGELEDPGGVDHAPLPIVSGAFEYLVRTGNVVL